MYNLRKETIALLQDVEKRIDPETEEDFRSQWQSFLDGEFDGRIFSPHRKKITDSRVPAQNININDALADKERMLVRELEGVSHALASRNQCLVVRANYGTGIMTSLFGAKIFTMPYKMNTLPTTYSWNQTDKIHDAIAKGIPHLETGLGKNVFEMGEFFREVFSGYPKITHYVAVYHPDLQGPLDICELLWGGEMFYGMYDEPETVHQLLRLVTDTYKAFMDKWFALYPCSDRMNSHWGSFMHHGRIVLRDDSAMNLSPELYAEFAQPYDEELLRYYGGGVVHFCGRGDHYIENLSQIPFLTGVNLSQPHLNRMETVYQNTVDKGIRLLGFDREWAEKDAVRPQGFCGICTPNKSAFCG